jgi:hypothetical protein
MNLNPANARIAELERQVRELTERLESRPIVRPSGAKAAMCGSCEATARCGGTPVCGCIAFGPTITCAVA